MKICRWPLCFVLAPAISALLLTGCQQPKEASTEPSGGVGEPVNTTSPANKGPPVQLFMMTRPRGLR